MAQYRHFVSPGMRVVGSDGNEIGTVCGMRADEIVVQRTTAGSVAIKLDTIQNVEGQEIILTIPSTALGPEGQPLPPAPG